MSQYATLYRISQDIFKTLETSNGEQEFDVATAKTCKTFEGSFMAIEYILSKGQDDLTTELIREIFSPSKPLGEQAFENLSPEEQFELYESGNIMPYLDDVTISKISTFIETVSLESISTKYDADELNKNGVYPNAWHNDNSPDKVFNKLHIMEDFETLKAIFKQAGEEKDYIIVFGG